MSLRRTRKKQELEDTGNIEDEETALDLMYLRIKAPIIWEEWEPCYKIQDMKENYYDDAIALIKESHMKEETMCRSIKLYEDPKSVESYEEYLRCILKDSCSLMALCTETQQLVGVIIMRVTHLSDYGKVYSRVKIHEGERFQKILDIQRYLNRKTDVFDHMDCEVYLRIYLIDVMKEHEQHNLSYALMRGGYKQCKSLQIPVAMGLFSSAKNQELASIFGMNIVDEVYFVDWREQDGLNSIMIFDDPGIGNYTVAVMAGPVPPPVTSQINLT